MASDSFELVLTLVWEDTTKRSARKKRERKERGREERKREEIKRVKTEREERERRMQILFITTLSQSTDFFS